MSAVPTCLSWEHPFVTLCVREFSHQCLFRSQALTTWENSVSWNFNHKTCLSLRIELAFKSKTEQAKQGVFRVFGKAYQPTCKYTDMALSVLKGIIERFPVLAAVTLHNRLPRRLKGFAKAFFVNVTSCNGIEVKLSELTPCTHIGICPCSSVWFACWCECAEWSRSQRTDSVEESENSLNRLRRDETHPPTSWRPASQVLFYFSFLTVQRTENPLKNLQMWNSIFKICQAVTSLVILKLRSLRVS